MDEINEHLNTQFEAPGVPEKVVFQQDNAPPYSAKRTREKLDQLGLIVLDWPANSPDLNPIEHIWAVMKQAITERIQRPTSRAEMYQAIQEEWIQVNSICSSSILYLIFT
jgi:transposase